MPRLRAVRPYQIAGRADAQRQFRARVLHVREQGFRVHKPRAQAATARRGFATRSARPGSAACACACQARFMPSASRLASARRFCFSTVVVFAGRHVARGAIEMHVGHSRQFPGAHLAGHADKVVAHLALAVVALRMRGVVRERSQRRLAVPEADRPHQRVDRALGLGANLRGCEWRCSERISPCRRGPSRGDCWPRARPWLAPDPSA